MYYFARYWKKLACEYKTAADEAKVELEEFQEDSRVAVVSAVGAGRGQDRGAQVYLKQV